MRVLRYVLGVIFLGGGLAHLVLGRTHPAGYASFGKTALLPALTDLWSSFVMPNIGVLTVLLGVAELLVGVGLLSRGSAVTVAASAAAAFLVFIVVLGCAFPVESVGEDLLKNRLAPALFVMCALLVASRQAALARTGSRGEPSSGLRPDPHPPRGSTEGS